MSKEFLVFVEEDDDGQQVHDRIVLQVDRTGPAEVPALDVHPTIAVSLRSEGGATAHIGLAASIFGALLGIAALATFAVTYPNQWILPGGTLALADPLLRLTAGLAAFSGIALVAGAILTHYGRHVVAEGDLIGLDVVERRAETERSGSSVDEAPWTPTEAAEAWEPEEATPAWEPTLTKAPRADEAWEEGDDPTPEWAR